MLGMNLIFEDQTGSRQNLRKLKKEKVDDLRGCRRETEEGKGTGPARTFKRKQ